MRGIFSFIRDKSRPFPSRWRWGQFLPDMKEPAHIPEEIFSEMPGGTAEIQDRLRLESAIARQHRGRPAGPSNGSIPRHGPRLALVAPCTFGRSSR